MYEQNQGQPIQKPRSSSQALTSRDQLPRMTIILDPACCVVRTSSSALGFSLLNGSPQPKSSNKSRQSAWVSKKNKNVRLHRPRPCGYSSGTGCVRCGYPYTQAGSFRSRRHAKQSRGIESAGVRQRWGGALPPPHWPRLCSKNAHAAQERERKRIEKHEGPETPPGQAQTSRYAPHSPTCRKGG